MCLDRPIGLFALGISLALAACGGGATGDAEQSRTYEYVAAVRPLAYDNAHEACSGHSLTSLRYEYGAVGSTFKAAARDWARRNQRDERLRDVSYRGCLDALRETEDRPVQIKPPALTEDEIDVYITEYSTCLDLTVADLANEYGLDLRGMTLAEAVLAAVRKTYGPAYQEVAYEACLAAVRGEPPRYGS
jgi:hypothetical protein